MVQPKQKKILLIIDEEGIRETLCGILEDEGWQCIRAQSQDEVLTLLNTHSPDVAVLGMPREERLKILKEIKSIYPNLFVIVTAANWDEEAVKSMKAITWLKVPVSLEQFLLAVKKAY